jgi:pilus assembly protein Flp/PilA
MMNWVACESCRRRAIGRRVAPVNRRARNDLRPVGSRGSSAWHTRCDVVRRARGKRRARFNRCGGAAPSHRFRGASSGEDSMSMLIQYVKSFARDEEGQDLLEYALLVALIALVAIAAVTLAGGSVSTIFGNIAGKLNAAAVAN